MCASAPSSLALVHRFFWAKQANNLLLIQLIYHLFSFWNNKLIPLILLHHDHKPDSHSFSPHCRSLSKCETLSWVRNKTRPGFGKGQGCRTWYLRACLLSQHCILFRLPSGGTVSKKTRKEMGWKQRKRKGTQCDGACPSLIQVQPETCGQWRHRCYSRLWTFTERHSFIYCKWKHKQPNKIMNEGGIDVICFSCFSNLSDTDWHIMKLSGQMGWCGLLLLSAFFNFILGIYLKTLQ